MKKYRYKAYDAAGVSKQGTILAISSDSAKFKLKESGLIPVYVLAEKSGIRINTRFQIDFKPGIAQIEEMSSRLALLFKNGIRVDKALESVLKGIKNNILKKHMEVILDNVRKGAKLSDSFEESAGIFDPLYVSIVRVGEESGKLAQAFLNIASNLAFHRSVLSKTKQAMIYPAIIFAVCVGAVIFVLNFIIPRFSEIFTTVEKLPFYTRLLLDASTFFRHYQLILFPVLVLGVTGVFAIRNHASVKKMRYWAAVNLPLVSNLCFTLENLRFASALSMLLESGVILSDALEYAIGTISNTFVKKRLISVRQRVRQGETLSVALADVGFLPDVFDGLVEVGEQTGNLAEVFREMETRLKSDYENKVAGLITLVEPVMIILMAAIVGSVVVSMLLSMVSVNDMVF